MIRLELENCDMILTEKQKKILESSSNEIHKYEYLTGEEKLLSNQRQITEQAKVIYSSLGKAFENEQKNSWWY